MEDIHHEVRPAMAERLAPFWSIIALALSGCAGGTTPEPEAPARAPAIVQAGLERAVAPDGYAELSVGGVVSSPGGHAVVLIDAEREVAIPIFVGGTEALAIELRHNKQRYARPLTHDLLDDIMTRLGGKLVKIQIDDIRDDTFIGAVYVVHGGEVMTIDARPSDAIALALGSEVPIFVRKTVVERAGIRKEDLTPEAPSAPSPTAPTSGPQPI
jgi:bifunctional DNase/RNase